MRIFRAAPGDARELTRIAFSAKRHRGYPERWIQRWKRLLTLTPAYVRTHPTYAVRNGSEIVGFASMSVVGGEATLDHIWVSPSAMAKGIGSSLFRHCEKEATKSGASILKVESDPHAEGFYHSMDAATVGRRSASMKGKKRFLPLLEKRLIQEARHMPEKKSRGGYTLSCVRSAQQPARIHAYLTRSYWAEGIPLSLVKRSIKGSLCFGIFVEGKQVAFARVITDSCTFAYLCDVYVLEGHRGKGLAGWMLDEILAHPRLQRLRRFTLATRDAHSLYARHGFVPLARPQAFMEIHKRDLYPKRGKGSR
jgi:GNAT superfamily N-acetyltransferase